MGNTGGTNTSPEGGRVITPEQSTSGTASAGVEPLLLRQARGLARPVRDKLQAARNKVRTRVPRRMHRAAFEGCKGLAG